MIKTPAILWLSAALALSLYPPAEARPGDRYTVECSILPAAVYVSGDGVDFWDVYGMERVAFKHEFVATPFDCPQYRISLWSTSPIVVDFGFQIIHSPDSYGNEGMVLFETGFAVDLGRENEPLRPFVGPTVGFMSSESGDQEGLVGGKAGIRYFLRDWAAARLQVDYRMGMADRQDRLNFLGLTAGVGFFL